MTVYRKKALPYKLMVFLLYSTHPSIERRGDVIHVKLGPLSVRLQVSKSRLADYLHWLSQEGLLTLSHIDTNSASVTPRPFLEAAKGIPSEETPEVAS